ncbi:MAG: transketolase C-terminal domain-containing protein [Deferrisomatales bacterium]|nr:transketolase C-terminal domain-containing protein [Deferrisomatales bacterium]
MSFETERGVSLPVLADDCPVAGREITYREAIREALGQALELDRRVFLMGEGIDDVGGVYGSTLGLAKRFGPERVMDTPIAENGMTGVAVGAALAGMRPVFIHMRADFLPMAMDQIVNHAAKWRYMTGGKLGVPLTIRAVVARGWGSAAQHAQSLQGLFAQVPGLRVVMPASPRDAKGMLLGSIFGDGPTLVLEHRWLYDCREAVPEEPFVVPGGSARVRRDGRDVTLVGVSHMVTDLLEAAQVLAAEGISAEVIDLRSLRPLDEEALAASVLRTGRLLVADTDWVACGVGAEVAALAAERVHRALKAPVRRLGLRPVPAPASPALEAVYYPSVANIVAAVREML